MNIKDIEEYISNMPESIINGLISKIEEPINRAGLFVRVFGRVKTVSSLQNKLKTKDYNSDHKIQDLFGVRITAYFKDDVKICKDIMQRIFEVDNISEDLEIATKFEPERLNIVCKIPTDIKKELGDGLFDSIIDDTFEIQIRTVFSEGWHEVEHDLHYKCKNEWSDEAHDLRTLNGIYATLITCDWAIIKLFDERAYTKYKKEDWAPMLKNKFRIKFATANINDIFLSNKEFMKEVFKLNREQIISILPFCKLPLSMDNFLYIANILYIHYDNIKAPAIIEKTINQINTTYIKKRQLIKC